MATPPASAGPDPESREWLRALRAEGAEREEALARLHALLLGAARFEVSRRRATVPELRRAEADDLALQAADDALMGVLRRLGEFRGASRFTTWAYKFALLEAAVAMRRRSWAGREVRLEPEAWELVPADAPTPHEESERAALVAALREAISADLTPRQREVLVALAVAGVPIDVLAERLGATRGALYKTLHDARRRLRAGLAARGMTPDGMRERP